ILPSDAQPPGNAHDAACSICFALLTGGFILCGIPVLAEFASLRVQRNAGEITSSRSHHSPSPILRDDGYPVAGEIYRRARACSCGRLLAAALRESRNTKTQRHKDPEKTRKKKSFVARLLCVFVPLCLCVSRHFLALRLLYTASTNASFGPSYSG